VAKGLVVVVVIDASLGDSVIMYPICIINTDLSIHSFSCNVFVVNVQTLVCVMCK
jgi:hypothetical protein